MNVEGAQQCIPFVQRKNNAGNYEMELHCNACRPRKAIRATLPTVCQISRLGPYQ